MDEHAEKGKPFPATLLRRAAVALLLSAAPLLVRADPAPAPAGSSVYDLPFVWVSDRDERLRLDTWRGHPVVITMAYSSCGRVCVMTLHKLEELQATADRENRAVEFVVVGYNPLLDTPAAWASYRSKHKLDRSNWHFLTGAPDDTHALARMLGIDYWLYEEHVMHDFKIVLLSPDGRPQKSLDWNDRNGALF
ncbi:MAG: SCO family protein [Nevskia sp.]|nr:SCO family protein [Nevskia sp.]